MSFGERFAASTAVEYVIGKVTPTNNVDVIRMTNSVEIAFCFLSFCIYTPPFLLGWFCEFGHFYDPSSLKADM